MRSFQQPKRQSAIAYVQDLCGNYLAVATNHFRIYRNLIAEVPAVLRLHFVQRGLEIHA